MLRFARKSKVVVVLVVVLVVLVAVALLSAKSLKRISLSPVVLKSSQAPSSDALNGFELVCVVPEITEMKGYYLVFKYNNEELNYTDHVIVSTLPNSKTVFVKDVYPSFSGRIVGFVPFIDKNVVRYIIFTDNDQVYNPYTISQPWMELFVRLSPKMIRSAPRGEKYEIVSRDDGENEIVPVPSSDPRIDTMNAVKAPKIPDWINLLPTSKLSSRTLPMWLDMFEIRIMYKDTSSSTADVYSYDPVADTVTSRTHPIPPNYIPSLNFIDISPYTLFVEKYRYSPSEVCDRLLTYSASGKWESVMEWRDRVNISEMRRAVESRAHSSYQKTLSSVNEAGFIAADFDSGSPIFMIVLNGDVMVVDRYSRKWSLTAFMASEFVNFDIGSSIVDFTKIGAGDYDYLFLGSNGVLYGPGIHRSVRVKELIDPRVMSEDDRIVSISSIIKNGKRYLVVYSISGRWCEIPTRVRDDSKVEFKYAEYLDPAVYASRYTSFPQSHITTNKLWYEFVREDLRHTIVDASMGLRDDVTISMTAVDWGVFVFTRNPRLSTMFSMNYPEGVNVMNDMFLCSGESTKWCVGSRSRPSYSSKYVSQEEGIAEFVSRDLSLGESVSRKTIRTDLGTFIYTGDSIEAQNVEKVLRKVSFEECISQKYNLFMYDSADCDCFLSSKGVEKRATSLTNDVRAISGINSIKNIEDISTTDRKMYVGETYISKFNNAFCLKVDGEEKYLYYDANDQRLKVHDECYATDVPRDYTNVSDEDFKRMARSVTSVWTYEGEKCLANFNESGGNKIRRRNDGSAELVVASCQGNDDIFVDSSRNIVREDRATGDLECLTYHNNGDIRFGSCENSTKWIQEPVPCPDYDVDEHGSAIEINAFEHCISHK